MSEMREASQALRAPKRRGRPPLPLTPVVPTLISQMPQVMEPKPQPQNFALLEKWQCYDQSLGKTDHEQWTEGVAKGDCPTCPTCGSHCALQVRE